MPNIIEFVESLGGLHDAKVLEFIWRRDDRRLEVGVHDLYIDSEGLEGYPGATKARFVFSRVLKLDLDVDLVDAWAIYDWTFKSGAPHFVAELIFSPAGKLTIECGDIECLKE